MQATWEKSPIVDVKLVDQNSNQCPDSYELAASGEFAGYYAGCDCSETRRSVFQGVRIGYCDRNETLAGCRIIERVDAVPYRAYDGKLICIKRDPELNFYNIQRPVIRKDAFSNVTQATC